MFPNPQDALPLPARPHLEQYKKQAKELVKACKSADPGAIHAWAAKWVETLTKGGSPHDYAAAPGASRALGGAS